MAASPADTPLPATPLCPHFGVCGGCQHQDLAYADQLTLKAAALHELYAAYLDAPPAVVGSPRLWYYRNKAEFKFDREQFPEPPPPGTPRDTVLGFRRGGRWYWTLELEECRLVSPAVPAILQAARDWLHAEGHTYYDQRARTGLLQHLVLREGKRTGERLVIVVTGPTDADLSSLVPALQAAAPVSTVVHAINTGNPDVAQADETRLLHGDPCFHETLAIPGLPGTPPRALRFRVSPFGFFQVNPWATELLYGHLRAIVQQLAPPTLYDLYGGSGGIALSCSDLVEQVISVEEFEPASVDGRVNAAMNGVTNVTFITRRVEGWLGDVIREGAWAPNALAILDPPRSALHPKALRRILEVGPPHILYVSCNPKLLARELAELTTAYTLVDFRAFDLFPHTKHVEVVAHLVRRPDAPPPGPPPGATTEPT